MSFTLDDVLIDLHAHSSVSDGTDTPAELIAAASAAGLDVIALTDHDTTAGWSAAAAALPAGLSLVRGAELSCESPDGRGGTCTVHLLAYLFDPTSRVVAAEQARLREERRNRLRAMAEGMAGDGFPIDPDEVIAALPPDATAGRPHLAVALVRAGIVHSVEEAFDRYLATGSRYHRRRADTSVFDAIEMINDAGGVTVLAHAFAHHRGVTVTPEVIKELASVGMAGLEVDHPNHDAAARAELADLADRLGLVATGSSDYHGDNKPIRLGQETTARHALDALVERTTGVQVLHG